MASERIMVLDQMHVTEILLAIPAGRRPSLFGDAKSI